MMDWVDWLLNGAALLLWLSWRTARLRLPSPTAGVFGSVLKPAAPPPSRRYLALSGLVVLLGLRAALYWRVGAEVDWVPLVNLGAISLAFNSASLPRMLLFSGTSFAVALTVFYVCLLFLSAVNRSLPDSDFWQRMVRQNLGWVERWPAVAKLGVPVVGVAAVWWVANPLLVDYGMTARPVSVGHLLQQALVIGAGTILAWKYIIGAVFFLHVLNSYLYLGNFSFWTFVNATARRLLDPLQWLPLRWGRIDFAPVLGFAVTWLGFIGIERGLNACFGRLPL